MTTEQHQSDDNERQQSASTVTAEEFATEDVEAPIRDSSHVDCWTLGNLYQAAASKAENDDSESVARVFGLLSAIAKIHFKPEDRSEPYGPQFVMSGRRSMIPADLRGEQCAVIAELVPTIQNPGLRARLADIVWYNDRKMAAFAQHAISAYCDAVQLVLDGKGEFFNGDRTASGHDGCRMLRRACQIALAIGWKDPEASRLRALARAVTQDACERQDHRGYLNSAELGLLFRIDDDATIAANAETLAASKDLDPHWSRDLWHLAARAHRNMDNNRERERCLVGAAECLVALADAAGGTGMVAAGSLMDAIQALRRLPNTRERREQLERRLREAQAAITDEMGVISTEIDLTNLVDHARQSVAGVGLPQALAEFVNLTASPEPEALRDQTKQQAEQTPLSSMLAVSVVDEDGKVVASSPGLFGDQQDDDLAFRHLIARNEGFRRQCDVSGLIEPARQLIQSEHPLAQDDFRTLVEMSPFVPGDRVELFSMGFARFFGGDFISALHVLVPQLENSLRHVLKQAGVEPSAIQSDMTQENRTLSVMLTRDREALEAVFGAAIVYEIENIFDFRGGPSIRHQLAHGLISGGECYGTDSIYACWIIFRLCCLPLFPHWHVVAERLDQL